jgi:hypothetical protein
MNLHFFLKKKDAIKFLDSENLPSALWKVMCKEFFPLPLLGPYVTHNVQTFQRLELSLDFRKCLGQQSSGIGHPDKGLGYGSKKRGPVGCDMPWVSVRNLTDLSLT